MTEESSDGPAGNPADAPRSGRRPVSRRAYLASAGGLGASLFVGGTDPVTPRAEVADANPSAGNDGDGSREDFLWLGRSLWEDAAVRENLYAFARRHDLAVVLVKGRSPGDAGPGDLRTPMMAASEFDLDVWLNVGMLGDLPAEHFVAEDDRREAHLEWLRSVARLHADLFDGGRVILWQEAPVMGQWVEGGAWNEAAVENLLEHGPEIFRAQQDAIQGVTDALDVGLFVHFPYIVDSKRPDVFPDLVDGIRAAGGDPAFAFTDFYRGWYEKDVGPGPANDAVRSLVSNARAALGGRPVYYLGQSHTINPNHTPSKQAMRMNLRASLEAEAAGIGWYVRNRYLPTESGFDPFVPNVDGANIESESVNTYTVARDRFLYPSLATLSASGDFDATDAFDLWLAGDGFGLYDHRLSLKNANGDWEYVGDFGGYVDGVFAGDSAVTDRATIFRALDRERYLAEGDLECRIETGADTDGATLTTALAMPCAPAAYVSESEAAEFVDGQTALDGFASGRADGVVELAPGTARSVTITTTDESTASLQALRHPDYLETVRELPAVEMGGSADPDARFDLWVRGAGVGESGAVDTTGAVPSLREDDGTAIAPEAEATVARGTDLTICHGLERERFLDNGELVLGDDVPAAVEACYAMPAVGRATFRSPAEAARLLATQPEEVGIFSLDSVHLE